jgi:HK97 family phage major capsid protein/HK97 family phage prohead protease
MEHKAFELKFATSEAGVLSGYASLFGGPPDSYGDVIDPRAFDRTLAEGRPPQMLVEHEGGAVGEWIDVQTDELGLRVKGKLDLETDAGRQAYQDLQSGALDGLSIGYVAIKADRDGSGVRNLRDVTLREVSLVRRPASSRARVLSVKSQAIKESNMADETKTGEQAGAAGKGAGGDNKVTERVATLETKLGGLDSRVGKIEGTATEIKSTVDNLKETVEAVETKSNRPGVPAQPKDPKEEVKAFMHYARTGEKALETKAVTLSDDGAAIAPPEFVAEVLKDLQEISPVRQFARVSRTGKPQVTMPNRAATIAATWTAENTDATEDEPDYDPLNLDVYQLAVDVPFSNMALDDADFDLETEMRADLAEAFGVAEGSAFVTGDGSGKPTGILSNANVGSVDTGTAGTLDADDVMKLYHSLKQMHRRSGAWMMNSATLEHVRKLKDGDGRYLVTTNWQSAPAEVLLGRPIAEAPDMPDIASGQAPILFGDLGRGFRIFDRLDLSILRNPYSMAKKSVTVFHARRRLAAGVVRPWTMKKLTVAS